MPSRAEKRIRAILAQSDMQEYVDSYHGKNGERAQQFEKRFNKRMNQGRRQSGNSKTQYCADGGKIVYQTQLGRIAGYIQNKAGGIENMSKEDARRFNRAFDAAKKQVGAKALGVVEG